MEENKKDVKHKTQIMFFCQRKGEAERKRDRDVERQKEAKSFQEKRGSSTYWYLVGLLSLGMLKFSSTLDYMYAYIYTFKFYLIFMNFINEYCIGIILRHIAFLNFFKASIKAEQGNGMME